MVKNLTLSKYNGPGAELTYIGEGWLVDVPRKKKKFRFFYKGFAGEESVLTSSLVTSVKADEESGVYIIKTENSIYLTERA